MIHILVPDKVLQYNISMEISMMLEFIIEDYRFMKSTNSTCGVLEDAICDQIW